ncbi:MAG TPA: dihydrodipicolinate synthase family protein [Phycisphaerae bacterium]
MITTLTTARLTQSVLAVPPLCRNADFSLNTKENTKLLRHIEAGGVDTMIYGGNANLYHVGAREYNQLLMLLESSAGADTLVIPSVGPTFGTMMDQATILRGHTFPTAMLLPMQGAATSEGVDAGIRRFVDAAHIPAVLYVRTDNYVEPARIAKLIEDKVVSAVKYAVVRENPAVDAYLRAICEATDPQRIISGLGEQPAIIHMRDFKVGGFTAGVVCVAPHISHALLQAINGYNWNEAERLRQLCVPLENLRNAGNPIRVLHEAVRLAGIANTGPLLPLLSNIPESEHAAVQAAAQAILEIDLRM